MGVFITGCISAFIAILTYLFLLSFDFHESVNSLTDKMKICEESLARNQQCELVAQPKK